MGWGLGTPAVPLADRARSPTCYAAPVGHADRTEAVVGRRSDLARTPRAVVVAALHIRVGHGVWIIRVEVIATFRALKY